MQSGSNHAVRAPVRPPLGLIHNATKTADWNLKNVHTFISLKGIIISHDVMKCTVYFISLLTFERVFLGFLVENTELVIKQVLGTQLGTVY